MREGKEGEGRRGRGGGGRIEEVCVLRGVTYSKVACCKCCTSVLRFVTSVSCALICVCNAAAREVPFRLATSIFSLHTRHTHSATALGSKPLDCSRVSSPQSLFPGVVHDSCSCFYHHKSLAMQPNRN